MSTRRSLVCAVATMALAGCGSPGERSPVRAGTEPDVRLEARPTPRGRDCAPGEHELGLESERRAIMRVTPRGQARRRGVLLALHGAGSGGAPGGLWAFRGAWEIPGIVIVAPAAAGTTWTLGPKDVDFVDRVLQRAFRRCPVDSRRVAVGGFSAGAGLALWLGLANGNLFRGIIALSPGSSLPGTRVGKARVFVAHGIADAVIPIGRGGDVVARELRADDYQVTYRRFEGGHRVRPEVAREAVRSLLTQP